jgi:hypothetical protein
MKNMSRAKYIIIFSFILGFFCFTTPAFATNSSLFSMSLWAKPATSVASKALIGKSEEMRMATDSNGYPLCQIKSTTWQTAVTSSTQIAVGSWAHIVCTYDLILLKIYVNGILTGTQALTAVADDTAAVTKIGKDDSASTTYGMYTGILDEYKFFNYPLTSDDVKTDFDHGMSAQIGSSGSVSGTGAPTNAASGDYCVPGDTTSCAGPVGEWKMDEKVSGDAKTINDTSGSGYSLTTVDGANNTGMDCAKPGKFGTACDFDGVDDRIETVSEIIGAGADSVCAWIYPRSFGTPGYSRILENGKLTLSINATNNRVTFSSDNNTVKYAANNSIVLNRWQHVCATRDAAGMANIYIDGKLSGTANESSGTPTAGTNNFSIGDRQAGSFAFNGLIDQVRTYGYVRTPAQIAWEYNKGKPVAEWRMNECQGGTIHDESGFRNNGTINLGSGGSQTTTLGNGTCVTAGTTPWYAGRAGKYNGSLNFDGTDDYVSVGSTMPTVNSVSLWIKPGSTTQSIIDLDGGTHKISISSGAVTATGFTSYYVDGNLNGTVSNTNWHHIIAVASTAFTTTTSLKIGAISSTYFSGQIDDVKIFNYALTPLQVKNLYNASSAVNFGN